MMMAGEAISPSSRIALASIVVASLLSGAGSVSCGARTALQCDVDISMPTTPNLYFVLDRSGSMAQGDKWQTVREGIVGLLERFGGRAQVGVAVFPSSNDECDEGAEVIPLEMGRPARLVERFRAATLAEPSGATPTAAALRAARSRLVNAHGSTALVLATDGGPNCNGGDCAIDDCTLNIDGETLHYKDGTELKCLDKRGLNCCAIADDGCLDAGRTIAAVEALRAVGIPTYVIGIPGSAPYARLLDRLAEAGGTARTTGPGYYRLDSLDAGALDSALADITARVACEVPLTLDGFIDSVWLDGTPLPASEFRFDGRLQILGEGCALARRSSTIRIHGVGSCRAH